MRIGIDLGGTKIAAAALDATGTVMAGERRPSPTGDYRATVEAVVHMVETLERRTGQKGTVGIGIPGTISPATGLIKNANSTWLIGHAFDHDLAEALGRPVRIANDADCFALSEATDGAASGAATVFGVILGTGVGGGLIIDGSPMTGRNAIAGEWGHNPLPWPSPDELPGPQCYCGRLGCIETFLSGPGLSGAHLEATGEALEPADIARRAVGGEAQASRSLALYQDRLARSLATVINIFDPEIVVLGGGLSNIEGLYDAVPLLWGDYVFSDRVDTALVPPRHGDAGGVRGAAWLWPPDGD